MVEIFSRNREKISTILFFCKIMGKTFDCFFPQMADSIEISKQETKAAAKNVTRLLYRHPLFAQRAAANGMDSNVTRS